MSGFVLAKVEIEETAATIAADREYIAAAVGAIKAARGQIERQIRKDRFFLTALEPYDSIESGSQVISRMCDASKAAGVGPMATVAGAIAQVALEAMASEGCTHGWVDNGGDIALLLERPETLEVFSDPRSKTAFALELEPNHEIFGVCSSRGRLGHSISFGNADVALAIADDAILADALATAIGNAVKDLDSLKHCFGRAAAVPGFRGGIAMLDGNVAVQGRVPKIIEVEHNPDKLTVHSKMADPRFTGSCSAMEART